MDELDQDSPGFIENINRDTIPINSEERLFTSRSSSLSPPSLDNKNTNENLPLIINETQKTTWLESIIQKKLIYIIVILVLILILGVILGICIKKWSLKN